MVSFRRYARSVFFAFALALAPAVSFLVARPAAYLARSFGDSHGARAARFTATLAQWRQWLRQTRTAIGANLTRQGHGFRMTRCMDDYEGFGRA